MKIAYVFCFILIEIYGQEWRIPIYDHYEDIYTNIEEDQEALTKDTSANSIDVFNPKVPYGKEWSIPIYDQYDDLTIYTEEDHETSTKNTIVDDFDSKGYLLLCSFCIWYFCLKIY